VRQAELLAAMYDIALKQAEMVSYYEAAMWRMKQSSDIEKEIAHWYDGLLFK